MAILSTLIYHLFGWPQGVLIPLTILAISAGMGIFFLKQSPCTALETNVHRQFAAQILLVLALSVVSYYLLRHRSIDWIGSSWQLISLRSALLFFATFACGAALLIREKISAWVLAFFIFVFVSFNSILFPLGYGFDIFVHGATIREWLTHGIVAPRTILYNGYHGIISIFSSLTHLQPITVMTWLMPLMIAAIFALLHVRARPYKRGGILILILLAIFPPLWLTTTPQALGHIMLCALILEYWISSYEDAHLKIGLMRWIIAIGTSVIHPLSGIPACFFAAYFSLQSFTQVRTQKIMRVATLVATIITPAALIIFSSHASIDQHFISLATIQNIFTTSYPAFQPFVLTKLSFAWHLGAPFVLFILALFGLQQKTKNFFYFSIALVAASLLISIVRVENIIGYEQGEFARRILFVAYILWIPLAVHALHSIIERVSKNTRIIIYAALLLAAAAGWYTAYAPWNSVARSKGINISPIDAQIILSIDARANGKPYIVLADQVTSAAALHQFGFSARTIPHRDYYFYPIPTGGVLYTKYFLPAIYNGITQKILQEAAHEAGVSKIFFVLKPYWEPTNDQINALKTNTTDMWKIGGAYIGESNH